MAVVKERNARGNTVFRYDNSRKYAAELFSNDINFESLNLPPVSDVVGVVKQTNDRGNVVITYVDPWKVTAKANAEANAYKIDHFLQAVGLRPRPPAQQDID